MTTNVWVEQVSSIISLLFCLLFKPFMKLEFCDLAANLLNVSLKHEFAICTHPCKYQIPNTKCQMNFVANSYSRHCIL